MYQLIIPFLSFVFKQINKIEFKNKIKCFNERMCLTVHLFLERRGSSSQTSWLTWRRRRCYHTAEMSENFTNTLELVFCLQGQLSVETFDKLRYHKASCFFFIDKQKIKNIKNIKHMMAADV